MILLYSNAASPDQPQPIPSDSTGGYTSSTHVYNAINDNLFSSISQLAARQLKRESRLLVLKNTTGNIVNPISFTVDIDDETIFKYKIGFVLPADKNGKKIFELLTNKNALPVNVILDDITDGEIFDYTTNLLDGELLGIWVIREFDKDKIVNNISCEDLEVDFEAEKVIKQIEEFKIKIDY